MATVTKSNAKAGVKHSGVAYGNQWADTFKLATNASGVMVDSNQTTALLIADVVRLGVIPAGTKLLDSEAIVSDAFTASSTGSIGFQYVDGVDSTVVPQDAAYFHSALALDAAALTRRTVAKAPVVLPKDAYVIVTLAGANMAAVGIMDIVLSGQVVGAL